MEWHKIFEGGFPVSNSSLTPISVMLSTVLYRKVYKVDISYDVLHTLTIPTSTPVQRPNSET
jgi:hypothetical protein